MTEQSIKQIEHIDSIYERAKDSLYSRLDMSLGCAALDVLQELRNIACEKIQVIDKMMGATETPEHLTYEQRLYDASIMLSEADMWGITLEAKEGVVKKQAEAIREAWKVWGSEEFNEDLEQYLIDNGYVPKP